MVTAKCADEDCLCPPECFEVVEPNDGTVPVSDEVLGTGGALHRDC